MEDINIVVLGSDSMLGKSLEKILNIYKYENLNVDKYKFLFIKTTQLDLREYDKFELFLDKFTDSANRTIIINLQEYGGGLVKNINNTLDMYIQNQEINHNLLTLCYKYNIFRVINLLSTSMFGDDTGFPLKEEYIDEGVPHYSNLGYAHAKKNAQLLSSLINLDSYFSYVNLISTDLYGEFDNYNLNESTVIPSIIHKCYKSIKNAKNDVELLGNGLSERMFIYVDDLSKVILDFVFKFKEKGNYIVAGSLRKKIKINELAELIVEKIIENGYTDELEILFNENSEFNGQNKRTCLNENLKKLYVEYDLEFPVKDKLEKYLDKIIVWFWNNINNYSNI